MKKILFLCLSICIGIGASKAQAADSNILFTCQTRAHGTTKATNIEFNPSLKQRVIVDGNIYDAFDVAFNSTKIQFTMRPNMTDGSVQTQKYIISRTTGHFTFILDGKTYIGKC